mmetsp:Transcript_133592/g.243152  ORF Transcript_133592/g.243152 Transcript_133592/m.243152 type:complete len:573 (+) Transcript_133592:57-1775(+)
MQTITLGVLVCVACLCHGRRSQTSGVQLQRLARNHKRAIRGASNLLSRAQNNGKSPQVSAQSVETPAVAFNAPGAALHSSLCRPHRPSDIGMGANARPLPNPPGKDRNKKLIHLSLQANPLGDAWRVGTLQGGQKYLWRPTSDPEDPEIKFVEYAAAEEEQLAYKHTDLPDKYSNNKSDDLTEAPSKAWKLGILSCGQLYLWCETDKPDDPEIRLVRPPDGEEENVVEDDWRLDFLPCGKAYLWRLSDNPDNPEVTMWKMPEIDESKLSSKEVSDEDRKREIYEFRKNHLGRDHAQTLKAMNDLLASVIQSGRQAEAKLLMEAYDLSSQVFGPQDPETMRALENYASASSLQKQVLELSSLLHGREHPETLKALNDYAMTVAVIGCTEEALPLHKEVLELTRRIHEPGHPSLLSALKNYAITLQKLGRDSEAEPVKKELLECTRRYARPESTDTLRALNSHAATLSKLGRHAEAEAPNKEVYKIMHKEFGRAHPLTLVALRNYAVTVSALGREAEAEPLKRKVRALTRLWKHFKGFGVISKQLGPLCHMEAPEFFKEIEQQEHMMEFDNPYA